MKKIIDTVKQDWPMLLIVAISFLVGAYFYPSLPDMVPSHWDIHGQVNGYTSKLWGAFGIPLLILGLFVSFIVLPYIDPKRHNYEGFLGTYRFIRYLLIIFFVGIHILTLTSAMGIITDSRLPLQIGLSLLFILLGNVMGRFKPNYFLGIRTPWTLANEDVWKKTHRMAAPIWTAGGVIGIILALTGIKESMPIFFGVLMVMVLMPLVYSYLAFQRIIKN